jgi:hypothetical protein
MWTRPRSSRAGETEQGSADRIYHNRRADSVIISVPSECCRVKAEVGRTEPYGLGCFWSACIICCLALNLFLSQNCICGRLPCFVRTLIVRHPTPRSAVLFRSCLVQGVAREG